MTKVSIVVPVYKIENYIAECIDSVFAMSFQDWELILVDDGSPDNSGKICDEYAAKDKRIRVIHKENGGVTSARREGVTVATGEWIFFVDGDDMVEVEGLSGLVNYAKKHPNVDIVEGSYLWFYPDNTQKEQVNKAREDGPIHLNGEKYSLSLYINTFGSRGPWSKIIRKSVIEKSNALTIPRYITNREDAMMLTIIARYIKGYALLDLPVYQYRSQFGETAVSNHLSWDYWIEYLRYLDEVVLAGTGNEWEEVWDVTAVDVFGIIVHGNTKIQVPSDYFFDRILPVLWNHRKTIPISEYIMLCGFKVPYKIGVPLSLAIQLVLRIKNFLFRGYYSKRARK